MNAVKNTVIKPLNPKSPEIKYTGGEPTWKFQPTNENRVSCLANGFAWYNYHYGKKDAKDMIAQWLQINSREKDARTLRGIPDSQIRLTPAWVCRMNLMGLELTEHEQCMVDNQIGEMLRVKQEVKKVVTEAETAQVKLTIQDHLREKVSECAGELEGMFDDFIAAGAKMSAEWKPIAQIRGMNISPNMVGTIADAWKNRLSEFEEVLEGNDADLVEGYSHLNKNQIKQCVKFIEQVIADCGSYVQIKKVERKPRAKKAVSPEKLSSKFKYLKEFAELKLVSIAPAQLVGAAEAWLYDTKKRKLVHVIADSHAGTCSVKGSAIVGFDPTTTVQKTLRKPAEQLKELLGGGKPAARKVFKDIKATETKFNGRGNENLIILKSW
jgi:uncharacterized protein (DUF433 family)